MRRRGTAELNDRTNVEIVGNADPKIFRLVRRLLPPRGGPVSRQTNGPPFRSRQECKSKAISATATANRLRKCRGSDRPVLRLETVVEAALPPKQAVLHRLTIARIGAADKQRNSW